MTCPMGGGTLSSCLPASVSVLVCLRFALQGGGGLGAGKVEMHVLLQSAPTATSKINCTYVAIATVLWLMGTPTTQWGTPPHLQHFAKTVVDEVGERDLRVAKRYVPVSAS